MKISNNALNFLLAQYRAIFKRAYVKGIASAVILTAGLAAGQAQAADEWYKFDNTSSKWTEMQNNVGAGSATSAAGALDYYNGKNSIFFPDQDSVTGTVSGGDLSIGHVQAAGQGVTNPDAGNTTAEAMGGHIYSSGNASITNFVANDNKLTLKSGGSVGTSAYGANVNVDKGNVTATINIATINGGTVNNSTYGAFITTTDGTATANDNGVIFNLSGAGTAAVTAAADTDGIFGARIKSENGFANASGNYVDITVGETATLSLGNGGNGIVGALAEGTESVSVSGNSVEITVKDDAQISGTVHSIQGGFALNQTSGSEASTLTADSNSVTATGLSLTSTSGAFIFGGRAMQDSGASGAASELVARNNRVSLTSTSVSTSANALQVVGNMAYAAPGTAPTGNVQNSVSAIGDGTTDNVYVEGGNFSNTSTSLVSGFLNPDSMIAGGYAETVSGGGNADANLNNATIKNITGTNINLYGGVAYSNKSAEGDEVSASQ